MIFGFFGKKAPPILRPEMLEPVDAPISTAEAKRIFKEWMVKIGHLERAEVSLHTEYLAEEIKSHEQFLKEELADSKREKAEELKELKAELRDLKAELAKCTDESGRKELEGSIAQTEKAIEAMPGEWSPEGDALEKFRRDKRAFLVDYINTQVHGEDWKSKG